MLPIMIRSGTLAIWSIENFFDDDVRKEMIEEYYGKYNPAIDARITLYRGLVAIKWGLWAALQVEDLDNPV